MTVTDLLVTCHQLPWYIWKYFYETFFLDQKNYFTSYADGIISYAGAENIAYVLNSPTNNIQEVFTWCVNSLVPGAQ